MKNFYIKSATMITLLTLSFLFSFAQQNDGFYLDLGIGAVEAKIPIYSKTDYSTASVPVVRISVGCQIKNIVLEGIMQPSVTKLTNSPVYLGGQIGYNIHNIIPSIGYMYNYCNSDNTEMNYSSIAYSLKYQIPLDEDEDYDFFMEGMYIKGNYGLTAGLHINFSNN